MRGVIAAVIGVCMIVVLAYWLGGRDDRAQDEVNRLEREKDISDAIDNDAGLGWRERLRNATE